MAVTQYVDYAIDLNRDPPTVCYNAPMAQGDKIAHTLRLKVTADGTPASLAGVTVAGEAIRSDKISVGLTGSVNGSMVLIPIPSAAYVKEGRVNLFIRFRTASELRTVLFMTAMVQAVSSTGTVEQTTTLTTVSGVLAQALDTKQYLDANYSTLSNRVSTLQGKVKTLQDKTAPLILADYAEAMDYLNG